MGDYEPLKSTAIRSSAASSTSSTALEAPTDQELLGNGFVAEQLVAASPETTGPEAEGAPWREAYGDRVGGKAYDAIAGQLTDEKLVGHATKLVDSAMAAMKKQLEGSVSPNDQEAYALFMAELDKQLKGAASGAVTGSGVAEGTRGLVEDHPYAVGSAALAGAVAYVLSNQDLPMMSAGKKLGDHHELSAGIDPGSTLNLGVEEARLGYAYNNGGTKASLEGSSFVRDGGWQVKGAYQQALDAGSSLNLSGVHTERPGEDRTRLDLGYTSPSLAASAFAQRTRGENALDTIGAKLSTVSTDPHDVKAYLSGQHSSDGSWRGATGISQQVSENQSWGVEGYAGQDATGKSDSGVMASWKLRF